MELRHLRYFVAVAEALSFTRAARNLNLAQPSLTRQIRNLEDELNVRLFERANSRIALTDEGRLFLFDSKRVLALCADSVTNVRRLNRQENIHLNIGYITNVHYGLLPATLGAFRKLYPRVALNLFDMTSAEQFQALGGGKIDVGFIGLNPALSGYDLLSERVAYDVILAALPNNHPLATKPKIKLADLATLFFVCMSAKTQPGIREWLLDLCEHAGFLAKILQEADVETTALKFVAGGLGVALLPEQVVELPHEGVVFRPLSPPLERESTVAWRADNPSRPLNDYIQIVKDLSLYK